MKSVIHLVAGLIFMVMLSAGLRYIFGIVRGAVMGEGIRGMVMWQYDWNDAVAEATAKHKRLLVEFARESSANCHELAKKSWSRLDIANAASDDYEPVLLDIDAHPDLAKKYAVYTVPALLVIDANDKTMIRDGRDQALTPDELLLWLKPDSQPLGKLSIPEDFKFDSQKSIFDSQKSPYSP